jgi:NitT/TauT family transport system substrate-binding protein
MNAKFTLHLAAALVVAGGIRRTAAAADLDFGKQGDPVELVIGFQPYYTESWSGVVMKNKVLRKYLPKGSKVDFQIGLRARSS